MIGRQADAAETRLQMQKGLTPLHFLKVRSGRKKRLWQSRTSPYNVRARRPLISLMLDPQGPAALPA